jgi:hypothetical protein
VLNAMAAAGGTPRQCVRTGTDAECGAGATCDPLTRLCSVKYYRASTSLELGAALAQLGQRIEESARCTFWMSELPDDPSTIRVTLADVAYPQSPSTWSYEAGRVVLHGALCAQALEPATPAAPTITFTRGLSFHSVGHCVPGCEAGGVCDPVSAICLEPCAPGSCQPGLVCGALGLCEQALPCAPQSAQPDACSSGQYCALGVCRDVPLATCANLSAHGKRWTPRDLGPVLYRLSEVYFVNDSAACGATAAGRVKLHAEVYSRAGGLPPNVTEMGRAIHHVAADGSESSLEGRIQALTLSADGRQASFDVSLCVPGAATTHTVALHFEDGNEICATAVK